MPPGKNVIQPPNPRRGPVSWVAHHISPAFSYLYSLFLARNDLRESRIPRMNKKYRIKWHHLYYMLAAFDILAVSGSLYLNHQIMSNYNLAVEVNQIWANRLKLMSNLADLAIEVNAPGNNVFDDGNASLHRSLRDDAHHRYLRKVVLVEQNFSEIANPGIKADFLGRLDNINAAMDDMLEEADSIFSLFDAHKGIDAGSRMATMDRKAAQLLTQISSFTHHIQDIQKTNFDEQLERASSLRRYEYLIAGVIVVMVLLVTIYGHKLAVQIRRTQEERERSHSMLKKQARLVEESEKRLSTILDSVSDGIIIVNAQGTIEDLNPAAQLIFGYLPRQVLGKNISFLIPEITDVPEIYEIRSDITADQTFIKMEFVARRKSGEQFHIDFGFNEFEYAGETRYTCIVRDINSYKIYRDKIKNLAMKDSLTGLFNRNSFNTYFRRTLKRDQDNAKLTALMLIDIDRFKFINDTYGHHVGDMLLIQATEQRPDREAGRRRIRHRARRHIRRRKSQHPVEKADQCFQETLLHRPDANRHRYQHRHQCFTGRRHRSRGTDAQE